MTSMPSLYFPFTLRLYAHVLRSLCDHNFTGLDLFYRIKDCWKERDTPHDLLVKPLEKGLAYKIGEWCFDTLFYFDGKSESMSRSYFSSLGHEDLLWFLDDVFTAARLSGLFTDQTSIGAMEQSIGDIEALYEADEQAYWRQIDGEGRKILIKMFSRFCHGQPVRLRMLRLLYAPEVADRILHDRQLCSFIARTVMDIGFDGETIRGLRSQWVQRETWPVRVKEILNARDRGKCSACAADIVHELHADGHIDHIFPISQGGCNDLVNLQLLCSTCNRKKSASSPEVTTSVPPYIRRAKRRRDTAS